MLAYARRVGGIYFLHRQGAHAGLMTAGKDRARDAGRNDTSQKKELEAYTL
jgi:hypothetical protein